MDIVRMSKEQRKRKVSKSNDARECIKRGIERAKKHGYTKEHDICIAILVELEGVFELRYRPRRDEL